jgi:hypothetical protein
VTCLRNPGVPGWSARTQAATTKLPFRPTCSRHRILIRGVAQFTSTRIPTMDLEQPPRVAFADSDTDSAHRTRSDPQRSRDESFSAPPRAVTFSAGDSSNGNDANVLHKTSSDPVKKTKNKHDNGGTASAYYDSRASTRREFKRRASTLSEYYAKNPSLLPQLPYSLRRGWRRWKVIGMGIFMVIDACVVPIILYYALTFGANIAEWIS